MNTFTFRLATLLKLRENERQQRQVELGQALEAERILQQQADGIAAEIGAAKDNLRAAAAPGEVSADAVLELQRYTLQLRAHAHLIAEQAARIRAEVERRRGVLTEADRQVRILEKLRDKQAAAFRAELEHREVKLLDEIGQRKRTALA
jgi:flagellar protein FliJ